MNVAGFLVCLALAGFVGALLWFAYALAVASARRDQAFAREFPELFPTPATQTIYDQLAGEYPAVAARIEAAALNDDAALETWLREGWTP